MCECVLHCTSRHMHRPKAVFYLVVFRADEKHMCQLDCNANDAFQVEKSQKARAKGARCVCVAACLYNENCSCAKICNGNARK